MGHSRKNKYNNKEDNFHIEIFLLKILYPDKNWQIYFDEKSCFHILTNGENMSLSKFSKKFGPGLLHAAATIGVGHLVQSTRAGAQFGFELLWAVVVANVLKYPFFKIGPKYTALTGKSLLTGYKKIGNWTLILFFIMTLGTMFTVQSAITIVTGGLLNNFFNLGIDVRLTSSILLIACTALLIIGRYNILDNIIKIIIIILTVTTIVTVIYALTGSFNNTASVVEFSFNNKLHIFFLIALIGWMPAPMDIPIWHGLWSMAKNIDQKSRTTLKDSMIDFNVGYITTAILAICFLSLGAIVMHKSGVELSLSATIFAGQLVTLYTSALGDWSYIVISIAAFTTMLSTTLTCLDAFARILREAQYVYTDSKSSHGPNLYNFWLIITVIGSIVIFYLFLNNMKSLVDLATTVSFLVAPIYAYLNFRIMTSDEIPKSLRPNHWTLLLYYSVILI